MVAEQLELKSEYSFYQRFKWMSDITSMLKEAEEAEESEEAEEAES